MSFGTLVYCVVTIESRAIAGCATLASCDSSGLSGAIAGCAIVTCSAGVDGRDLAKPEKISDGLTESVGGG